MKPQFKPEEIYLNLSKLSEEQINRLRLEDSDFLEFSDVELFHLQNPEYMILSFNHGKFNISHKEWFLLNDKTELTYSQFLDMMGESEEVLQVENNGWIKILSETDLPKEVDQYWFASHNNKIEIRFYNPNWINDRVQFRHRYTHYQPIVKPLPPKF